MRIEAMNAVQKILDIGSEALCIELAETLKEIPDWAMPGPYLDPLWLLLGKKNGFVAFEGALLVFPLLSVGKLPGIFEWNHPNGWRRHYKDILPLDAICFAEDAFAGQFALTPKGILKLDPESGSLTQHSESLNDWASKILGNYDVEVGWSIARGWQLMNGPLPLGYRLLGKKPFVIGGDYIPENLVAIENSLALERLGRLYRELRDVPDGQEVEITGWL
jgi:hypothetical protein